MEKDVDSGPCHKNLNKGLTLQTGTCQHWKHKLQTPHTLQWSNNGGNRFNTSVTGSNSWIRMGPKWRMVKWCQMQVWNNDMYTAWEWGWQNQMNYFSSQHQEIKMVSRHRQSGFCTVFVGWWAFKWSPITPLSTYSLTLQNSLYPTHPRSHTFKWAPSICLTSGTWKGLTAYIAHAGSSVPHLYSEFSSMYKQY